jgi:hypothetical protein
MREDDFKEQVSHLMNFFQDNAQPPMMGLTSIHNIDNELGILFNPNSLPPRNFETQP